MITILVACHKPYRLPLFRPYTPIEVGASSRKDLNLGGFKDDQGQNISNKNPNFCELTALFWAWKNLGAEHTAIGLVHYRRYFGEKHSSAPLENIYSEDQWKNFLTEAPVILPPRRNYFIETVKSQYVHAHHEADLEVLREVIQEKYPSYLANYDRLMSGKKTHILNMFVMRRDIYDKYCEWLFDILFEVERKLDISGYSTNDARVFGFLSERLLDVWIDTNKICYIEKPLIFTEKTNWLKKGSSFLLRKLGIRKK